MRTQIGINVLSYITCKMGNTRETLGISYTDRQTAITDAFQGHHIPVQDYAKAAVQAQPEPELEPEPATAAAVVVVVDHAAGGAEEARMSVECFL